MAKKNNSLLYLLLGFAILVIVLGSMTHQYSVIAPTVMYPDSVEISSTDSDEVVISVSSKGKLDGAFSMTIAELDLNELIGSPSKRVIKPLKINLLANTVKFTTPIDKQFSSTPLVYDDVNYFKYSGFTSWDTVNAECSELAGPKGVIISTFKRNSVFGLSDKYCIYAKKYGAARTIAPDAFTNPEIVTQIIDVDYKLTSGGYKTLEGTLTSQSLDTTLSDGSEVEIDLFFNTEHIQKVVSETTAILTSEGVDYMKPALANTNYVAVASPIISRFALSTYGNSGSFSSMGSDIAKLNTAGSMFFLSSLSGIPTEGYAGVVWGIDRRTRSISAVDTIKTFGVESATFTLKKDFFVFAEVACDLDCPNIISPTDSNTYGSQGTCVFTAIGQECDYEWKICPLGVVYSADNVPLGCNIPMDWKDDVYCAPNRCPDLIDLETEGESRIIVDRECIPTIDGGICSEGTVEVCLFGVNNVSGKLSCGEDVAYCIPDLCDDIQIGDTILRNRTCTPTREGGVCDKGEFEFCSDGVTEEDGVLSCVGEETDVTDGFSKNGLLLIGAIVLLFIFYSLTESKRKR